jgi:hypothetical protein
LAAGGVTQMITNLKNVIIIQITELRK